MKKLLLIFLLLTGCTSNTTAPVSAVYFVHGQGVLSAQDLQAHPEVIVVQTFDELRKHVSRMRALWIDKSTTPFNSEQQKWINEAPQTYSPIVFVGTSDTVYAFRDLLGICCFLGPAGIYPGYDAPGFSVIQSEKPKEPNTPAIIFLEGYNQKPTVQSILEITNALLEGKLKLTPTASFIAPATPTLGPQLRIYCSSSLFLYPHVAIRATDLTFVDLILNSLQTVALIDHLGDIHLFGSCYMVEGQNYWISLATINARMNTQVSKHKASCFFSFVYLPFGFVP